MPKQEPRQVLAVVNDLFFAVKLSERTAGLRCALDDVPGSPARAQVVVGN